MVVGQSVEFTCECGAEQEQILEQTILYNYGRVVCWSCGESAWYEVQLPSYYPKQTPEQKLFWERWTDSLRLYREWRENNPDSYLHFETFHQERIKKIKS